jgi:uncharacterized SAM-binding protein YcdF (DUF218 family)
MTYTQPLLLIFLAIAVVGLVRMRRGKRTRLPELGLLLLILVSWPPADWLLSRPLEWEYPPVPFDPPAGVQAIVVLSSAVMPPHYERPYALEGPETSERTEYAAWIYSRKALPVLACGGSQGRDTQPDAAVMRLHLLRAGVPAGMIWTEERSHSTYENALYGAAILKQHGVAKVALVVDAQSMRRAAASFRKQGIEVFPAACSFRELGPLREELLPSWKAVRRNEGTLHEMGGLLWYRLRGRI